MKDMARPALDLVQDLSPVFERVKLRRDVHGRGYLEKLFELGRELRHPRRGLIQNSICMKQFLFLLFPILDPVVRVRELECFRRPAPGVAKHDYGVPVAGGQFFHHRWYNLRGKSQQPVEKRPQVNALPLNGGLQKDAARRFPPTGKKRPLHRDAAVHLPE